jgi:glycosyltransferase involved in cell wall biosynthesis
LWLAASRSTAAAGELALAEVLDGLLAQPALIAQYRRQAQAHAQAHYSWEQVTDQYEALLKQP